MKMLKLKWRQARQHVGRVNVYVILRVLTSPDDVCTYCTCANQCKNIEESNFQNRQVFLIIQPIGSWYGGDKIFHLGLTYLRKRLQYNAQIPMIYE